MSYRNESDSRHSVDSAPVIAIYLFLLFVIPANLVVAPLGSAGTPAQIFGIMAGVWWLTSKLVLRDSIATGPSWCRAAVVMFACAVLLSYAFAMLRPISPVEISSADRGIISLGSWVGIFFAIAGGVPSIGRLRVILRRLAIAGGFLASLGIVQFVTGVSFVDRLTIPGLVANSDLVGVLERSGIARPAGTATHPIEFGVVLAMLLPVAIYCALEDRDRSQLRRWYPVLAIAFGIPVSLSRSAVVATGAAILFLLPSLTPRRRRSLYAGAVLLGLAVYVSVPGLLGTLGRLFTGISDEGSAQSRVDSYGIAWDFIQRSPVWGRGFGTFLPAYRILDNQYLGALIELGVLGTIALLWMFVSGVGDCLRARQCAGNGNYRLLTSAVAGSIAAGACSFATFDAFGFPIACCLIFVLLGLGAALRRLFVGVVTS